MESNLIARVRSIVGSVTCPRKAVKLEGQPEVLNLKTKCTEPDYCKPQPITGLSLCLCNHFVGKQVTHDKYAVFQPETVAKSGAFSDIKAQLWF